MLAVSNEHHSRPRSATTNTGMRWITGTRQGHMNIVDRDIQPASVGYDD